MKRAELLKQFLQGTKKDFNILIEIDEDLNTIPADVAIRIWEQLNEQIPEAKKEAPPKAEPKSKEKKLDVPKMIALRNAGWTYDKIAEEMGCAPQTVVNRIRKETV